jgi:peptidoglycan/xylan/chitin deacetylase (PgdA/CDA1 family)
MITMALVSVPVFVLVFVIPHLCGRISRILLAERCRRARAVVLTYDDGPGGVLSPRLLSLLCRHRVRATFFTLGEKALQRPALMDAMKAEGHEVACHGFRHLHAWKVMPWRSLGDAAEGFDSLSRWLAGDLFFRPPYGKITLFTWLALVMRGVRPVWWTHDSGDVRCGRQPDPGEVADAVIRAGGGVVLLHDFDRLADAGRPNRHDFVLRVTEELIVRARGSGLALVTLGELLRGRRVAPRAWACHGAAALAVPL